MLSWSHFHVELSGCLSHPFSDEVAKKKDSAVVSMSSLLRLHGFFYILLGEHPVFEAGYPRRRHSHSLLIL